MNHNFNRPSVNMGTPQHNGLSYPMMMIPDPGVDITLQPQMGHSKNIQKLNQFWVDINQEAKTNTNFKNFNLPLARIKKIMKTDADVKMISQEAPVLFAKACEIFIKELTLRAWLQTEESKRKTLQRNDIAAAISKTDMFDFLIDIVPRDEIKIASKKEDPRHQNPELQQYFYQLQHQQQQQMNERSMEHMLYYQQQQQVLQQQQQYARFLQNQHHLSNFQQSNQEEENEPNGSDPQNFQ